MTSESLASKLLATEPLHGTELIDCAKANGITGIEAAAQNCGYGEDLTAFETQLIKACAEIGIKIQAFSDLVAMQQEGKWRM
jgi:hypothetical protein